jgi:hypothetical protein
MSLSNLFFMTLLSRFQWDWIPFHCRRPCPVKSESYLTGVNGNGKISDLCALCALSEAPLCGTGRAVKNMLSLIRKTKLGPSA